MVRTVWIVAFTLLLASSTKVRAEASEALCALPVDCVPPDELAAPRHWRLETLHGPVHVWAPAHYNRKTAATVVYVHGYHMDVDQAWAYHDLPRQFGASELNALFIAPESPKTKYEVVVWQSLHELVRVTEQGIGEALPKGRLVAAAYSGGHRTLDYWLPNERLDTLVLHDAMYGDFSQYAFWIRKAPNRRLIVVGDDTRVATDRFFSWITAKVRVEDWVQLPDKFEAARKAKTVYVRSTLGHWDLLDGGEALPAILSMLAR